MERKIFDSKRILRRSFFSGAHGRYVTIHSFFSIQSILYIAPLKFVAVVGPILSFACRYENLVARLAAISARRTKIIIG